MSGSPVVDAQVYARRLSDDLREARADAKETRRLLRDLVEAIDAYSAEQFDPAHETAVDTASAVARALAAARGVL